MWLVERPPVKADVSFFMPSLHDLDIIDIFGWRNTFWTRYTYVLDEVELYMLDLVQPLRPTCILVAHSVDLVHGIKSHLDQTLFTPRPNRRWTRSNCLRRYRAGTFGTVFVHGEYPAVPTIHT